MQFNNSLTYKQARSAYRSDMGWTLTGVPGHRLRGQTPEEQATSGHARLVEDDGPDAPQARLDLGSSGMIALEVPAQVYYGNAPCPVWQGLHQQIGAASAVLSADKTTVTLLLGAEGLAEGAPRRLTLDCSLSGLERVRPSDDQTNNIPLPHSPCLESWQQLSPNTLPATEELIALANAAAIDHREADQSVIDWLNDMFDHLGHVKGLITRLKGDPVEGLSRSDVHALLLQASGWLREDYGPERLSRAAEFAGVMSHRTKNGYVWLLKRNDKPLRAPSGKAVESIDPLVLAFAREIQATRELHPTRIRAKREAAEKAAREAAERAQMIAAYGSLEVQAWLRDKGFFEFFNEAEGRRAKAAGRYGEKHIPLSLRWAPVGAYDQPGTRYAQPSWFVDGPGLDPQERFKRIVQRAVEGVVTP